ncbi:MAG: TPR repeat protein, partial [Paraglaciecola sp.]
MDSPHQFINLNTSIINVIKCLMAAVSFTLAAPVFADDCSQRLNSNELEGAFTICSEAAKQGDAAAQLNLGFMHDFGKGMPQDDKQAVYWYRKAAEQGYAAAQYNLGLMYDNGEGT